MALDTLAKRASVLHIVIPDSTIDQADRQTILWVYGGILADIVIIVNNMSQFVFGEIVFGEAVFGDNVDAIT